MPFLTQTCPKPSKQKLCLCWNKNIHSKEAIKVRRWELLAMTTADQKQPTKAVLKMLWCTGLTMLYVKWLSSFLLQQFNHNMFTCYIPDDFSSLYHGHFPAL